MREPTFSGPSTQKMVQAISHDLDELGFVEGKDYIEGPRESGRTTRLLRDALLQVPWMDSGDEIFVVAPTWKKAMGMTQYVANTLAIQMGIGRDTRPRQDFATNAARYFLTFKEYKHIHFVSIEALEQTLLGRRLSHDPAFFFDHECYEFGFIQNASYDVYALLSSLV